MSRYKILLISILTVFPLVGSTFAGDLRPYKHPGLDLQFTASHGWEHRPRAGDDGTHERVDPETGIHVLMWRTSTEQGARGYLEKMSGMMALAPGAEPEPRTLDGNDAWIVTTSGAIEGTEAETILAVISSGRSRLHPFETDLFVVQIWCPAADGPRLADRMEGLLGSVRVTDRIRLHGCDRRLYPEMTEHPPDLASPFEGDDGDVYVTIRTQAGRYALVPVTVENGAPNDYEHGEWGKGYQLKADEEDFPTLARTGLHSEDELDRTTSITGWPVADITENARPGRASTSGFVAANEDVVGVIRGDNRLVARLGLTHPQLARPLFEIFNLSLRDLELFRRGRVPRYNIASVLYDGHEIHIEASASKGWQDSIFSDEILGYWSIRIWREPTYGEEQYLRARYGRLGEERLAELTQMLTSIRFGEMVPFYVARYGFYEGHTEYRADPIAIASLFGLMTVEEIDATVGGNLYRRLTRHYSR